MSQKRNVQLAYVPTPFIQELQLLIIIIIIINGGILSLTDSHHHHRGQNPTMVGICHGGNVLGNHDDDDEDNDGEDHDNFDDDNINVQGASCLLLLLLLLRADDPRQKGKYMMFDWARGQKTEKLQVREKLPEKRTKVT